MSKEQIIELARLLFPDGGNDFYGRLADNTPESVVKKIRELLNP